MIEHTPTPWILGPYGGIYSTPDGPMIVSADTKSGPLPMSHGNEAFIVEIVNSHDKLQIDKKALLEALKRAEKKLSSVLEPYGLAVEAGEGRTPPAYQLIKDIRKAIAQAEKEK